MSWMPLGHQGMWHERKIELGSSGKKLEEDVKAQGLGLRC